MRPAIRPKVHAELHNHFQTGAAIDPVTAGFRYCAHAGQKPWSGERSPVRERRPLPRRTPQESLPSSAPDSAAPRWPSRSCASGRPRLAARFASCSSIRATSSARAWPTPRATIPTRSTLPRDRCRSTAQRPATSSITCAARASTPRPETIYRARCTATTCARGSRRRVPARARVRMHASPGTRAAVAARRRRPLVPVARRRQRVRADDVVLALGNPPPASPARARAARRRASVSSRDPWSIGSPAHQRYRQRAARGQRTHDDRCGAAARGHPSARAPHPRALAPWLAAGTPRLTAPLPADQARRVQARSPRRAARRAAWSARFAIWRARCRSAGGDWREVLALARARASGAVARARSRAARALPASRALAVGRASPPRARRTRWARCGRWSAPACSKCTRDGSKK